MFVNRKMRKGKWAELFVAVAIAACGRPPRWLKREVRFEQTGEASVPVAQREVVYDFVCWMESDGMIKFWSFRDEIRNREGGERGSAMRLIQYRPDYPQYRNILKLVGPLAPGQKKAVPDLAFRPSLD